MAPTNHIPLRDLPFRKQAKAWLDGRYGEQAAADIWAKVEENYTSYLAECPDYGGRKGGHAKAIYGGLLVFALYPALPDQPPVDELQDLVHGMFMGPFVALGKVFNLNRPFDMWLIDKAFRSSGDRDRRDIEQIHGQLIRCGTCGNADRCDDLVVGSNNPLAAQWETARDEGGFLVSRRKGDRPSATKGRCSPRTNSPQ